MSATATYAWFARHEARLAWRDWLAMMTAGRRARNRTIAVVLLVFIAGMHGLAYLTVARYAEEAGNPDTATLVSVTGWGLLSFALMVSQAMESVTRAFYARADLDLILSSPAAVRRLFAVRIAAIAVTIVGMALLLAAPFINMLALFGGPHWLASYGAVAAMGATATAFAVAFTVALLRLIGPRRTRLVAQVVAAVIGAAFVIGLQIAAIVSYGSLSRIDVLQSDTLLAWAPAPDSILWLPARAMLGDATALAAVMAIGFALLAASIATFSLRFADQSIAAAGAAAVASPKGRAARSFRHASATHALRRKEWALLLRDPWLASQTLMQLLYLLPPALFLWRSYGDGGALVVMIPVLVMAAGQLAGGLAWLVISGEDAPDLVASAPVAARQILRAKIEAVIGGIAIIFAPFLAALALISPSHALLALAGIAAAAASATAIQFWFRVQARRSHFRRRQTSSRLATFAEAFSSISWAGTAAVAALAPWAAIVPMTLAVLVLIGARGLSPHRSERL